MAPLEQAVVDAGAIQFRPMLLTAAALVVGAFVTVPVVFFLMRRRELRRQARLGVDVTGLELSLQQQGP